MRRSVAFAIIGAALAVMLASGIRASFGLFQIPLVESLNTNRETYSLAIAISNLVYGIPLVGILADRVGSRLVLLMGGVTYMAGLLLLSRAASAGGLILTLGLLVGLGLSATTYVVVLGAVARLLPKEQHTRAFGLITAAGSSGMFVIPPVAQVLINNYGWQQTITILAGLASIIVLLGFVLPGKEKVEDGGVGDEEISAETLPAIFKRAMARRDYLVLLSGFFVCGFHVSFISAHLPAYLGDVGLNPIVGATALSLIGVFNIVGSTLFGYLGDTYNKKRMLGGIYFGRAVVISIFILFPVTRFSALLFASAMGFLWLATVPLTSGMISHVFGTRYLSTLYGVVFFSHQVGAFIGVWLGGRFFDSIGTYMPIWYMSIALGVLVAIVHLPFTDNRESVVAVA